MSRHPKIIVSYNGQPHSLMDISRISGCDHKTVYRYYDSHGTIDGFDEWRNNKHKRINYKGESLTFKEAANRIGVSPDTARRFYYRNGTLDGCGELHTDMPWLQKFYHTLKPTIPLDRCIAAVGFRSVRQFCKTYNLSESLVGCWRKGKLFIYAGQSDCLHSEYRHPTLLDEMTNFKNGISIPLSKIMAGSGFLEYELFPNIFTQTFYDSVYRKHSEYSYEDTAIEHKERSLIIRQILYTLPTRFRKAVEFYFGIGTEGKHFTYAEIGKKLGCTRERARQMLAKAIKSLRSPSRMKVLREIHPSPFTPSAENTIQKSIKMARK